MRDEENTETRKESGRHRRERDYLTRMNRIDRI
jgi:hypothetical protein